MEMSTHFSGMDCAAQAMGMLQTAWRDQLQDGTEAVSFQHACDKDSRSVLDCKERNCEGEFLDVVLLIYNSDSCESSCAVHLPSLGSGF